MDKIVYFMPLYLTYADVAVPGIKQDGSHMILIFIIIVVLIIISAALIRLVKRNK